jgi:hypothetical protein
MIDDKTLIEEIKTRLSITENFHDTLLLAYANDVKAYMLAGGVPETVLDTEKALGAIALGVSNLWHMGMGNGEFSNGFIQRVIQLRYEEVES